MKTRKKDKLKKALPLAILMPLASMVPLTSCGIFNTEWSFKTSSKLGTKINYCLLIGQNDHSDSIERTRYTRKALHTLDESEETKARTKDNPNIAKPVTGKLQLWISSKVRMVEYEVNEIEHMEQKSLAGATWDAITANETAATWIAKHGSDITFFVSNNDGMAEGAYWACNWIKGLPIFGYDANSTTIEKINAGRITGTVDQNASTQAGATNVMMRNMLEDRDDYWDKGKKSLASNHFYGSKDYNPRHTGFANDEKDPEAQKYGYVDNTYISENTHTEINTARAVLIKSVAIDGDNVKDYIKEDGSAKQPSDMYNLNTHIKENLVFQKAYNVCQTYASKSEAYLIATMRPYLKEYAKRLNINLDIVEGDGTDEAVIINQLEPRDPTKVDGYMINMVKTTATSTYVTALAKRAFEKEKAYYPDRVWNDNGWEFEDRLDTPVIFWNRQPHNDAGAIDAEIMNNRFFKYCYFVGVDAALGGQVQGEMIIKHIIDWTEGMIN